MIIQRPNISQITTALLLLFMAAYIHSAKVKSWVIMLFLMLGFFKPHVPVHKPGEKLISAPAFIVKDINGKTIDLLQQKGKVVFVNFWATWCPPCLAELPSVNNLYLKVKNNPNIVFLSVDADNDLLKSTKFLQKKGYQFPVYGGDMRGLPQSFYPEVIPTTVIVDKKGFIVFSHINRADYNDDKFYNYLVQLSSQ